MPKKKKPSPAEKEAKVSRILNLLDNLKTGHHRKGITWQEVESKPRTQAPTTKCGKQGFPSEGACRKAIKNRLRKTSNTTFLRPYFCYECHHWHMTSSRKKIDH